MLDGALGDAAADPGQRIQSRFVGFGEGVQILLGGDNTSVTEPLLDDLQVGAASEQPRGMCVATAVAPPPIARSWAGPTSGAKNVNAKNTPRAGETATETATAHVVAVVPRLGQSGVEEVHQQRQGGRALGGE